MLLWRNQVLGWTAKCWDCCDIKLVCPGLEPGCCTLGHDSPQSGCLSASVWPQLAPLQQDDDVTTDQCDIVLLCDSTQYITLWQHITLHSEAIWGVMIALVFLAIFEPHDENKSWWGRPKCQKKIFFKNIFEIFLSKIKYLKNIFHISEGKQHFWALWWKWKL